MKRSRPKRYATAVREVPSALLADGDDRCGAAWDADADPRTYMSDLDGGVAVAQAAMTADPTGVSLDVCREPTAVKASSWVPLEDRETNAIRLDETLH